MAIEFAHRSTSLGDGITGNDFNNQPRSKTSPCPIIKLGLHWTCCDEPARDTAPGDDQPPLRTPPVMRKGMEGVGPAER